VKTLKSLQRFLLPALAASALGLAAAPASAVEVQNFEAGVGLGFIDPGGKRNIDGDPAALLTFGARLDGPWGAEVAAMFGNDISLLGVRGLYHLNELPGAWTPYVSAGLGITDPQPGDNDTTGLIGVGVKHPFNDNLGLRAELNLHQGFDSGATDTSIFVGVTWTWGYGKPIRSAAATSAPVAAAAVPSTDGDADNDGVVDSRDRCPGTSAGAKVNSEGCAIDSDGDGISDARDNCPGTPAGVAVDDQGCPRDRDTDGDGVLDSADRCAGTPAGAKVTQDGCEAVTTAVQDTDGDGVADDLDKCANTPSGAKVDADGCTQKLSQKVSVNMKLNFDTDKADLKPEFSDEIGKVAKFMREYPGTSVVIEGHTDNTGNSDYNQKLSQRRAEAVADSLVRDHGISANRVKAVGYGDTQPIADNNTAAGRAQNRRVEAAIEETVTR
jgi:OOP family OmpA-OmpF porin